MPRKPKKIKVIERKLGREKIWGQAFIGENLIEVDERVRGKRRLKLDVHECGHLIFPNASEKEILRLEKIMGNFLWEQGYRKVDLI